MPFYRLALLAFLAFPISVFAQTSDEEVLNQLDSLYALYKAENAPQVIKVKHLFDSAEVVPKVADSIVAYRLSQIESVIPLDYNDVTQRFIDVYVQKKRYAAPQILALSEYYFPMIEEELDKAGLPLELKYMAVIESALQTKAVSRAGAVGMWQFMYRTGKMYKLDISTYVDERKDPLAATKAACEYLSGMYKLYGDWQLAIASYNCGPGNVNKAIRRSGGKKNFWEIYKYLPKETRGYVPAFIAATYLFNYYNEHNLHPAELTLPLATDTVHVKEYVHLHDVASLLSIDEKLVEELNPQYRRNIVPGSDKTPKSLVLPSVGAMKFVTQIDTINNLYLARVENRTTTPQMQTTTSTIDLDGYEKIYYTVKSGDNLGYIADWYDTYASRIRTWNGIYGNTIRVGQKLVIYVPKSKKDFYATVNDMSFSEKQTLDGKPKTVAVSRNTTVSSSGYIEYTVKSGDSIWAISQKHPGNTTSSILKLNNLSSTSKLQPGDVLKLHPNPNN